MKTAFLLEEFEVKVVGMNRLKGKSNHIIIGTKSFPY